MKHATSPPPSRGCQSRPSRARGLKHEEIRARVRRAEVAPLAGAWIETIKFPDDENRMSGSRPSRARGLKHLMLQPQLYSQESRPSRARGLKLQNLHHVRRNRRVAPLAGAWIETSVHGIGVGTRGVAPLAGAWIETRPAKYIPALRPPSRPSRARGLKPRRSLCRNLQLPSRPSRARGLKPFMGIGRVSETNPSRPSRARGLKHQHRQRHAILQRRAPRGRVD